ncbi:NADase-type glycan-binding domain-containing protein [Spirochaeta cellobiosiphila]|uniref:NADase-type glycan-binding domain-containing protein n=1 Tax=Spirochaeta cellobiosiphila TaxID=504483 RepID=UPI0004247539|nr:hypothetical protein [Spirochaeta cellobiosiphila]
MKKQFPLILIGFICILNQAYSQELFNNKTFMWSKGPLVKEISFSNGQFSYKYTNYDENPIKVEEMNNITYHIVDIEGISFISFENERWLFLRSSDFLVLYNKDSNEPFFFGALDVRDAIGTEGFYRDENLYDVSSSLSENINGKKINYGANNLYDLDLNKPWVEGVNGYGVGEVITINNIAFTNLQIYIYLSNGFVSFDKPRLYKDNSRVKKIKITDIDTNYSEVIDLSDTPQFQKIIIPKGIGSNQLKIEILDVYHGIKYDDTCINILGIVGVGYN